MKAKKLVSILTASILCMSMLPMGGSTAMAQVRSTEEIRPVDAAQLTYDSNSEHTSKEIKYAFDGNRSTFWDAAWDTGDKGLGEKPIVVDVEFDTPKKLEKFVYTPRQDGNANGQILQYKLEGTDENGITVDLGTGTWDNDYEDKTVPLTGQTEALKSVKFTALSGSQAGGASDTSAAAAEFTFYEKVKKAQISQESLALKEGESGRLTLAGIVSTDIVWTSSNESIAAVAEDGTVTAHKEGAATITGVSSAGETASCEVSVSKSNAPVIPGKVLVFEDNFNGTALDTTKWNNWCVDLTEPGYFRYGNTPESVVAPENVSVKDGTLRLLASKEDTVFDGQTSQYRMAAVQTRDKFTPTYGYMEAMIKIPDVRGSNPAIWMMPQMDEEGNWSWGDADTFGAEIDILERPHPGNSEYAYLQNSYWITMHYDNYAFTNHPKFHEEPELKNAYKWHKFGMNWTEDRIEFLLDDKLVATQDKDVPNTPEIFILSYGIGGWLGSIADEALPSEMEVDYVRWYQDIESEISLDRTEISLEEGETAQLEALIGPEGSLDKVAKWESSAPYVAEVDNGKITAKMAGTTVITVTTEEGHVAECRVTVTPKITVAINPDQVTLNISDTTLLQALISPKDADRAAKWESSDETVAKIGADGRVKALKTGKATITLTTEAGRTATCEVTVADSGKQENTQNPQNPQNPQGSTNTNKSTVPKSVKTGDTANIIGILTVMAGSLAVGTGVYTYTKKRKRSL